MILPVQRLEELCDPERGITYGIVKVGDFVPGGVPVIRGGDIRDGRIVFDDAKRVSEEKSNEFKRTILRGGEILINLIAEPGHTAIVPESLAGANVSRDVGVIPLNDTVNHKYVDYFLKSIVCVSWLTARLQGSVTQKINLGTLKDLPVPLPPLPHQERIAQVLGTLDDKIELNRRTNETLEAMARALFKSWFVDFDPVRAKAEGRQPPGMDPATAALFPSEFQPSELGPIPKGWRAAQLGDIARQVREGVKPSEVPPDTPYIGLEHMPQRSIALGRWGTASDAQSQKIQFRKGQILFGKLRPYFHKVGLAPVDGLCSTDIVVLEAIDAAYSAFCLGHTSSDKFVAYTNAGSEGTRMPRTSWKRMAAYDLPVPPASVVAAFGDFAMPLLERVHANLFESRILAETRDTLLPRLLSGGLSVGEAGGLLEATA